MDGFSGRDSDLWSEMKRRERVMRRVRDGAAAMAMVEEKEKKKKRKVNNNRRRE